MTQIDSRRRTSLVVPIVLIALGGMFLYANWRPAFDPWPILKTYWPLILIFVGLGKMWDARQRRQNPDGTRAGVSLGATFGALAFVLVLIILFWHGRAFTRERRYSGDLQHQSRTVDRQGAKSVNVSLEASAANSTLAAARVTCSTPISTTAAPMKRRASSTTSPTASDIFRLRRMTRAHISARRITTGTCASATTCRWS